MARSIDDSGSIDDSVLDTPTETTNVENSDIKSEIDTPTETTDIENSDIKTEIDESPAQM